MLEISYFKHCMTCDLTPNSITSGTGPGELNNLRACTALWPDIFYVLLLNASVDSAYESQLQRYALFLSYLAYLCVKYYCYISQVRGRFRWHHRNSLPMRLRPTDVSSCPDGCRRTLSSRSNNAEAAVAFLRYCRRERSLPDGGSIQQWTSYDMSSTAGDTIHTAHDNTMTRLHSNTANPERPVIFYRCMSFLSERHVAPTYSAW